MNHLKFRIQYLNIGAAIGFLAALVIGVLSFGALYGVLWVFVFGSNPWPEWTDWVMLASVVVPFMVIFFASLFFSYRYAVSLEKWEDQSKAESQLAKHRKYGMTALTIILMLLIGLILLKEKFVRERELDKATSDRIAAGLAQVKNIDLSQDNQDIKVKVTATPPYKGKYQIVLLLQAKQFAECQLLHYVKTIPEGSTQEEFEFTVPLKAIEEAYRAKIPGYISGWDEAESIDEMIQFKATLELFESAEYSQKQLKKLNIPFSFKEGMGLFAFSCNNDGCRILQEGAPQGN